MRFLFLPVLFISNVWFVTSFTLITFDVDGTLIQGSGQAAAESAHARAFSHAVGQVLSPNNPSSSSSSAIPVPPVAEMLPRRLYHGSTDGLILLRLARAALGIEPDRSFSKLDELMDVMYEYINKMDDEEISEHISPLPGVIGHLETLSKMQNEVYCGLVTGNVEGIARRKMRAVGIWDTGALSSPCPTQKRWSGTEDIAFLGGFGSDYCSGNIDDLDRNFLDRSEQIAIATKRCQNKLQTNENNNNNKKTTTTSTSATVLKRVVHVGDAPADVLAAKAYSENTSKDDSICVGMVAVATGSYSAEELQELAGEPVPGKWEPVILEKGMEDPQFLKACGL